jgi:hypothetical protein
MSIFKPTSDERDTLKKAVSKYALEPFKDHLLVCLNLPEAEYPNGSEEWNKFKLCIEQHALHAATEVRRDPNKKATRQLLAKADALARKFHPNFS